METMKRVTTVGRIGSASSHGSGRRSDSAASHNSNDAGAEAIEQQQGEAGPPEEHGRRDRPRHFIGRIIAAATANVRHATVVPQ